MSMTEPTTDCATADAAALPLAGVRVLDLSRVLAGPWATQVLADYGAEVIKVERPGRGDDTRAWGPPFHDNGDAAYFQCANRNKKSVTIDFTTPQGGELVRKLARTSAVVVENFKTGGLVKYGLDYASLRTTNPALVYCSITGFGQTGAMAHRAGYDYLIQAMGGLMSVTGHPDGASNDKAGGEPTKVGVAVVDLFTGMYAVSGILAALRQAEATGHGQHLDLALFDCQLAMLANQASNFLATGTSPGRLGNAHANIAPYQVVATADGHMVIAVGNDTQFAALCAVLNMPDLASDARFATNAARVTHRDELMAALSPILAQNPTEQWIAVCENAGVPCGPINTVGAALTSQQAGDRDMVITHPDGRRTVANPVKFGTPSATDAGMAANKASAAHKANAASPATPPHDHTPPPSLGADTHTVLREALGLNDATIAQLTRAGAI